MSEMGHIFGSSGGRYLAILYGHAKTTLQPLDTTACSGITTPDHARSLLALFSSLHNTTIVTHAEHGNMLVGVWAQVAHKRELTESVKDDQFFWPIVDEDGNILFHISVADILMFTYCYLSNGRTRRETIKKGNLVNFLKSGQQGLLTNTVKALDICR